MPHWLVIDLEATTEEGGWPVAEMEVIEIGATLVNQDGRELDHFERFVRPARRPVLTHFCRELTHINQSSIDSAAPLTAVWPQFERWLSHHRARVLGWASWGITTASNWKRNGATTASTAHCRACRTSISNSDSPRPVSYKSRWA